MFRVPSDVETTLMEDVIGASAFLRALPAPSDLGHAKHCAVHDGGTSTASLL